MEPIFIPSKKLAESIADKFGTPVFITDQAAIEKRVALFRSAFSFGAKIFYAVKANYNPTILKILKNAGIDGVDTVSPFEIELAKKVGFNSSQIIFTGNGSSHEELKVVGDQKILCNLGSLSELDRFGKLFPGTEISIRMNPGIGDGENKNVTTGGHDSKFGILKSDFPAALELVSRHKLKLIGLHCHIGSGFYKTEQFQTAVASILEEAKQFPSIRFVDLGGGFGVRFDRNKTGADILQFGESIQTTVEKFLSHMKHPVEIRFEPGKFLVAESTCLLTRVTTRKKTDKKDFVCVDTGFEHLIRPVLYGSQHEIVNIHGENNKKPNVTIVGHICESTDIFADDVAIEDPKEGDLLAILSAGAYGASMSSLYNLRPYATEVIVNGDEVRLSRQSPGFESMYAGFGFVD